MIATAKQDGNYVYVYNENGSFLFSRTGNLVGFTGSTVTVQNGSYNYTYDEKGSLLFSR